MKNWRSAPSVAVALAALAVSVSGCGYSLAGRGSFLPPELKSIGIPPFVNRTAKGFAHGPSSNTSSTANPSGVVQLITPMQVVTNLTNGSNAKIALFGFLTVHFIPEPGMLLLLGSGVAGLVLLGRHRMRK